MDPTTTTTADVLGRAGGWLIDLAEALDPWPTTTLVAALLILGAVGGVTGRCAAASPAIRQIILIIVTGLIAVMAAAVVWTLYTRIAPPDLLARTLELLRIMNPTMA